VRNHLFIFYALTFSILILTACAPTDRSANIDPVNEDIPETDIPVDVNTPDEPVAVEGGDEVGTADSSRRTEDDGRLDRADIPPHRGIVEAPPSHQGTSEGWPEHIQIPPGLSIVNSTENTSGGMKVNYAGDGTLDEINSFFADTFDGWEDAETVPTPVLGQENLKFFKYRGDETFMLEGSQSASIPPTVNIMLWWNWYNLPGETPDGWPDDIPVMPGFEILDSHNNEYGQMNVTLKGAGDMNAVAGWYIDNLDGWTRADPGGQSAIIGNAMRLTYERDNFHLTLNGNSLQDSIYIWLSLNETD